MRRCPWRRGSEEGGKAEDVTRSDIRCAIAGEVDDDAEKNLNDQGKALARAFGAALRQVGRSGGKGLHQQIQPRL
jgi:hypothetical protein